VNHIYIFHDEFSLFPVSLSVYIPNIKKISIVLYIKKDISTPPQIVVVMTNKDIKNQIMIRTGLWLSIFAVIFSVALETFTGTALLKAHHPVGLALIMIATLASLKFSLEKTTYLNFLGPSFLPPIVLKSGLKPKDATLEIEISTPKDALHVVYWAASPSQTITSDPWSAYGDYMNSGVAEVHEGKAILSLWCPGRYQVSSMQRKTLPKHVHYRYVHKNGMLSAIKTKNLMCI
jgi:hypothetical protein